MNANEIRARADRLAEETKASRELLVKACAAEGHIWDHPAGRYGSRNYDAFVPSDDQDARWGTGTTETRMEIYYARICTRCGFREEARCNKAWEFDLGKGHYECNPRTGEVWWVKAAAKGAGE